MFSLLSRIRGLAGSGTLARSVLVRPMPMVSSVVSFARLKHEYLPRFKRFKKAQKGRIPVRTGGSIKGCTLEFGKYGMRLKSEGVRLSDKNLKDADNTIMKKLRPVKGKLIRRLHTNIAVCTKGNETRMGKGKGAFDYWATRVPTGKIVFEIVGDHVHEQVAREAFRIAGAKLPGVYEFVKLDDYKPKVGFQEIEFPEQTNFLELHRQSPSKEYQVLQDSREMKQFMR